MRRNDAIDRALDALWREGEYHGGRSDEERAILLKLLAGGFGKLPAQPAPEPKIDYLPTNSIGTCRRCGYHGPGPKHDCRPAGRPVDTGARSSGQGENE
jgi:hypothetical protein